MDGFPKKFTAGRWSLDMDQPWPSWVTLRFDGKPPGTSGRPTHEDLLDLQYVVNRAVDAAKELK